MSVICLNQCNWFYLYVACGNTALHGSAAAGHGKAYNCLLSHGADTTLVNEKGDTSFEVAKKHGHPVLIKNASKCWILLCVYAYASLRVKQFCSLKSWNSRNSVKW